VRKLTKLLVNYGYVRNSLATIIISDEGLSRSFLRLLNMV